MNLLQLVFKQMRQRALSSWLTTLAVLLGVALAVALMITMRGSSAIFGQTEYGYDIIVGAKGSPLQLVLNTVYHLDQSPGNIPYSIYEEMASPRGKFRPEVRTAVPTAVGDSYKGLRIVGASPKLFGFTEEGKRSDLPFEYRPGKTFEMSQGNVYAANKFEAVIGSDVPRLTGLKLGEKFQATHGLPQPNENPDIHEEQWTVVGVMKPTHTAADRCLHIPLMTFYCIFEHEKGLEAQAAVRQGMSSLEIASKNARAATQPQEEEPKHYTLNPDGTINLTLPKSEWLLSAILVRSRGAVSAMRLMYDFANRNEAAAVNPASVMRQFFDVFLKPSGWLLQGVACLVSIVAAVSILVSIYNSVAARKKEIAILRALGATRARIVTLLCLEAGVIGLLGGLLGILVGHLLGAAGSLILQQFVGEGLPWLSFGPAEGLYLCGVVVIALLAGLVPAMKAYRTPVATNLVAG
jgi:putative ABC transport system permease protein